MDDSIGMHGVSHHPAIKYSALALKDPLVLGIIRMPLIDHYIHANARCWQSEVTLQPGGRYRNIKVIFCAIELVHKRRPAVHQTIRHTNDHKNVVLFGINSNQQRPFCPGICCPDLILAGHNLDRVNEGLGCLSVGANAVAWN
jgi:hypothetical protein